MSDFNASIGDVSLDIEEFLDFDSPKNNKSFESHFSPKIGGVCGLSAPSDSLPGISGSLTPFTCSPAAATSSHLTFSPLNSLLKTPDYLNVFSTPPANGREISIGLNGHLENDLFQDELQLDDKKSNVASLVSIFSSPPTSVSTATDFSSSVNTPVFVEKLEEPEEIPAEFFSTQRSSTSKDGLFLQQPVWPVESLPVFCTRNIDEISARNKAPSVGKVNLIQKNEKPTTSEALPAMIKLSNKTFVILKRPFKLVLSKAATPTSSTGADSKRREYANHDESNDERDHMTTPGVCPTPLPAPILNSPKPAFPNVKLIPFKGAQFLKQRYQPLSCAAYNCISMSNETKLFRSCKVCGQIFRYQSALREHFLCVHTAEDKKPFFCSYCNKGFVRRSRYEDHRSYHSGVKPYSCSLCFVGFTAKDNAIKHIEVCSGAKEYWCTHCGKIQPSHSTWRMHMFGGCPTLAKYKQWTNKRFDKFLTLNKPTEGKSSSERKKTIIVLNSVNDRKVKLERL